MEEGKAMFFVQGFFEIFETLLSYFSNTLSFVRIGAFAVSHAAMMEVVLMLAGAESGSPNWIVVVLGNLFVCGMEGPDCRNSGTPLRIIGCSAVSIKEAEELLTHIPKLKLQKRNVLKGGFQL